MAWKSLKNKPIIDCKICKKSFSQKSKKQLCCCKECSYQNRLDLHRLASKRYDTTHVLEKKEYAKKYYLEHKEQNSLRHKKYKQDNKEQYRIKNHEYYLKTKGEKNNEIL